MISQTGDFRKAIRHDTFSHNCDTLSKDPNCLHIFVFALECIEQKSHAAFYICFNHSVKKMEKYSN